MPLYPDSSNGCNINAVQFIFHDDQSKVFGEIYQDSIEKEVNLENKCLIGVFGSKSNHWINSIGFIVLERTLSVVKVFKFELS